MNTAVDGTVARDRALAADTPVPVIVLGGGPIGLVCALLLARAGIACELVDARPLEELQRDRRLLALSRGSLNLLGPLLGERLAPLGHIDLVQVSSRGEPGSALLGGADFPGHSVGATVWYADLVGALAAAAAAQPAALLRMQRPRRAQRIDQSPDRVRVTLDDGQILEGRLAVDAEGTPARRPDAPTCALLAELDIEGIAPGVAIERFTREGPLALLPLPLPRGPAPGAAAGAAPIAPANNPRAQHMSMIWCQPADLAHARAALTDAQLCALIAQALGARLGRPSAVGTRHVFPLATHRRTRVCEHRLVHLGNAAQTLHPVAGQGFNLGLRDCAALVEALVERRAPSAGAARRASMVDPAPAPWPGDPLLALPSYEARRRLDRRLLPALTGALPPLFSSTLAPVAAARAAGLVALDTLPGLRRAFTRLLMFGAG
jgi:2-octaprenyl-6-methoxyphenol hydroxylase